MGDGRLPRCRRSSMLSSFGGRWSFLPMVRIWVDDDGRWRDREGGFLESLWLNWLWSDL